MTDDWIHSLELPPSLAERVRCLGGPPAKGESPLVVYWMHHALRAHENPALDVALHAARQQQAPLLVYHEINDLYPFPSDRHHRFQLEGAADIARELADRGVTYRLYVQRDQERPTHLPDLTARATVLVTEEMPLHPFRERTEGLAGMRAAVLAVDTACVVPMRVVGQAHTRAFEYRNATRDAYAERIDTPWQECDFQWQAAGEIQLPFEAFNPLEIDFDQIIAQCEIDHAVGPAPHSSGGSRAGYARWNDFKMNALADYANQRNDPLAGKVSRMSPYLHYGMVSPLRLAREASANGTKGAEKYLDELLIWREMAHAFCFHRTRVDTIDALPNWARQTLKDHEPDDRRRLLDWETLARGRTDDKLWNAAQHSLLVQGELHNNVRMTWGKALLHWTPTAQRALELMLDLNHRYALDGRDPSSYGGILWCLGQFDRPFSPPQPVLGRVRGRSTRDHAKRLDVDAYQRQTTRPAVDPPPRVAVIGAGLSGLMCARTLADNRLEVMVFEKSRGPGGRMSTRRDGALRYDHGAQYFTVRDDRFAKYVEAWQEQGIVDLWHGRFGVAAGGRMRQEDQQTPRYVGVPGMNAVCKHLAQELEIAYEARVEGLEHADGRWRLATDGGSLGEFDYVVVSAPAQQTAALLEGKSTIAAQANAIPMVACWSAMLAVESPLDPPVDGAFVSDSPLSWVARNSSKPGRDGGRETWVLHASREWTEQHLEQEADWVADQLLAAFRRDCGAALGSALRAKAHRWRYSGPATPAPVRALWDPERRLGACGDWCGGPRVEGAFLSGVAVAGRVLADVAARARR